MRWALILTLGLMLGPILLLAPIIGLLSDPWAPWRLSGQAGQLQPDVLLPSIPSLPVEPGELNATHGHLSDAQRYQLARAAGWSVSDAITATALSIAEDGSGDPAALSGVNQNGTRDLGLWQVNSSHWGEFGGAAALTDPYRNAQAAIAIYQRQGWCAWSTYNTSCGPGHTGSWKSFLGRAQAASLIQPVPGSA